TEQTIFNTNLVQTIAHQRFQDPVQLAQPIQFNGQDIEFGNTLEGGQAVELGITTDRFLAQGIGAQNPLASIRINTKGTLQIQGNAHSINNLTLTSQEGFIEAGNLHTQGGAVTLETLGINTTITNHAGIQPGDIQVGAIQTRGGAVNVSAKRFFRAMNTLNGASISTIGPNTGDITIVHGGGLLNQPFIVGDPNRSNNGVVGALRTNIATVPGVQAFLGSVKGGNVQILAGRDNPPVNIQFISPSVGNSLTGSISNLATPLGTIEDLNTLEFQNAFGQDPIRQATPQAVQELLKAVNHRNLENQDAEKFAAVYLYYNRSTNAANEREDTIFSRGRILRPDDPPLAEDGLSLLVVTEQEIKQIQLPDVVNRIRVSQSIQLLRDRLMDQYNIRGYKPFAAQLYDWIALPIKEALVDTPVDNLIFVLGRGLRSLPVAALYNRRTDQFLIEEYGFALVPSISYLDSEAVSLRQTQALAMGASSFANNDNAPLPAVPFELDLIRQTRPTQVLQNEQFTFENLQTILSQRQQAFSDQPLIMHLATHADFGEVIVLEPEDLQFRSSLNFRAASNRQIKDISYLQFFDRKLRLEELQDLELNKAGAVELFVISACNTATGNDNAELGFAGLSLQMGAQSAVASLWK
ncbi:MAG: CHAT domain-containing protein, partial [Prochlorotrichaceae cyanobacterium]